MSPVPFISRFVENGVNGFLVDPFDVDAMANRVVSLARSSDISKLQENALVNARRFEISIVGEMWLQLFEECMEMRRREFTKVGANASLGAGHSD